MKKNITTIKSKLLGSLILITIFTSIIFAQTSNNYQIQQAVIDEGGNTSHSLQHQVSDVVGQPSSVGEAISNNYIVSSGFFGDGTMMTPVEDLEEAEIPGSFRLHQNYPNPFNPTTAIRYQLPAVSVVEVSIYNTLGQKIATLVSERQPAGYYGIVWDAVGFSAGVYFCRLEAGDPSASSPNKSGQAGQVFVQSKKLILMR